MEKVSAGKDGVRDDLETECCAFLSGPALNLLHL